jgi:hypothetical protein
MDLERRRLIGLRDFAIAHALEKLESERPGFMPTDRVVLFAAYE